MKTKKIMRLLFSTTKTQVDVYKILGLEKGASE